MPPPSAALRQWQALRGTHRALPHSRDGRPTDFLFVTGGHRISDLRIRRGLDDAVLAAGLCGADGRPLKVTPQQLRHTYATRLVHAGMSLQA